MTNDSVLFLINDVLSNPRAELLSIGFLLTIFFSTNGAYSLLEAFDASYHVNNEIGFFKKRLIALEITIIITLLVILSILFIILGEKIISFLINENLVNISSIKMFMFSKWLVLFVSLYSGITIIFFLANKKVKFKFINIGSVFSSLFIIITSILFSIYINNFDTYNKLYGSIGTLMIILLWMYFNSFILILGFELNTTFSKKLIKMSAKNIILLFCIISINLSAQIKYDPLYPPNSYRSSENPNYWKNKLPYPGYWQQDVYYEIDAEINEETDIISASQKLKYWNNSPDTIYEVYFHLYQNAFQPGSYYDELQKQNHKNPIYGKYEKQGLGTRIESIKVDNKDVITDLDNTILKYTLTHLFFQVTVHFLNLISKHTLTKEVLEEE